LAKAGDVLRSFVDQEANLPPAAWRPAIVLRRACAFGLFLLCCQAASVRRIAFDDAACGLIFRAWLESLERLRPWMLWPLGTDTGVSQAATLASFALIMRKHPYGALLLEEASDALSTYQLPLGMTEDGVWREGLGEQGEVISSLGLICDDLRVAGVSARPLREARTKLAVFATFLLLEDGTCPPTAETPPASYSKLLRSARAILKSAPVGAGGGEASTKSPDAKLFPQGGFFISKSIKTRQADSSQLVLQARPPFEGGPTFSFSCGSNHLLIGGGVIGENAAPEIAKASRSNPAAHNAVRVNGAEYGDSEVDGANIVRTQHTWRGKDWVAVRIENNTFAEAKLFRTVIHLTLRQGLLVVDEVSAEHEIEFEQFWHFSPQLQPLPETAAPLQLRSPAGTLAVLFSSQGNLALRQGGSDGVGWTSTAERKIVSNWYAVRRQRVSRAVVATLFRWSSTYQPCKLRIEPAPEGWAASIIEAAHGNQFEFRNGQLSAR
jgi:hypothetical protein